MWIEFGCFGFGTGLGLPGAFRPGPSQGECPSRPPGSTRPLPRLCRPETVTTVPCAWKATAVLAGSNARSVAATGALRTVQAPLALQSRRSGPAAYER